MTRLHTHPDWSDLVARVSELHRQAAQRIAEDLFFAVQNEYGDPSLLDPIEAATALREGFFEVNAGLGIEANTLVAARLWLGTVCAFFARYNQLVQCAQITGGRA